MGTMRVLPAQAVDGRVDARIETDRGTTVVSYVSPAICGHVPDALLAATLIPAMSANAGLHLVEPVSPRLLGSTDVVQDVIRTWEQRYPAYARYRRIDVEATARAVVPTQAGRAVTFFSGGVDSFYTALRHEADLTGLVFVLGFDIKLSDHAAVAEATTRIQAAADGLGKPLTTVTTDLRDFADPLTDWDHYHGAALASVALLLAGEIDTVYVPATHTYAYLTPLGSHPLLDPLWNTEDLQLVHDGLEASRLDKLAFIASHPAVRAHLHVCTKQNTGTYNCGNCEKCLRTMVCLAALGRLGEIDTLPGEIDPDQLRKLRIPPDSYTWRAALALLDRHGGDPALRRILRNRLFSRTQLALVEARRLAHRTAAVLRNG